MNELNSTLHKMEIQQGVTTHGMDNNNISKNMGKKTNKHVMATHK